MKSLDAIRKTISTFFYVGRLPFIPGTFASMAGIVLFYLVKDSTYLYILLTTGLAFLGFLVSSRVEELFGKKDPPCIVIDEVVGMLLGLIFIPYDFRLVIVAFLLFRALDSLKPYPAGAFQKLKGSIGIMSDDIIAGLYTNIVLQLVSRVLLRI